MKNNNADKKTIFLTGGGSAGHVVPNLLLLPRLLADGWDVHYLGSRSGIEAELAGRRGDITYHAISTGKLRRYFSMKNFTDIFRIFAGVAQSAALTAKIRPSVIFSKGGFVSAPVIIGGWLLGTPSIIHESDLTQGLANKICMPFASAVCLTFRKTIDMMRPRWKKKAVYTGAPIRPELFEGDESEGLRICGFNKDKPVLLAIGGSLGSESLNSVVRSTLPELLENWQVAHICGKGRADASHSGVEGYKQFEYVSRELAHIYKISRVAVSRAGSNTIFELLSLKIPSVLIPLPRSSSRGDQLLNAAEFERAGYSVKLEEAAARESGALAGALSTLCENYGQYADAMEHANADAPDSAGLILKLIYGAAKIW